MVLFWHHHNICAGAHWLVYRIVVYLRLLLFYALSFGVVLWRFNLRMHVYYY